MELFEQQAPKGAVRDASFAPLAERMRPKTISGFVGQQHLLGEGKPLQILLAQAQIPSLIFWGPPGCGKTTLARLIAGQVKAEYFQLNAVSSGVQEVRKVIERAEINRKKLQKHTLLFIDEIHRFNKAQQDALLHSVEDGVLTLIGATTENPSFEVISPLLSRCLVYVLKALTADELNSILDHALSTDPVVSKHHAVIAKPERDLLMMLASGDARMMLNGLETSLHLVKPDPQGKKVITGAVLRDAFQRKHFKYDKGGEEHYNVISAFIKSIRGSDPDAAVYWLARMIEGGEDPKFIARRMIVLASEDIGNADPQALTLATSCFTAIDYIGMPEAGIVLSQTATYLASTVKSNAAVAAIGAALKDVGESPNEEVPLHLRNAPTELMKSMEYGVEYKYSHDFTGNFVEQQYLPDSKKGKIYYRPSGNGEEKNIHERLNKWWKSKQR